MSFYFCNFVATNIVNRSIMRTSLYISVILMSFLLGACSSGKSSRQSVESDAVRSVVPAKNSVPNTQALPKAVIYRTNGDYNDNVPVNINRQHTALISYPACSDITSHSTPVEIGDGWLFDRRGGVGANTVFLTYTYAQYSALKATPSAAQLLDSVIPGSAVTRCILTPVLFSEALSDPDILKQYIPEE